MLPAELPLLLRGVLEDPPQPGKEDEAAVLRHPPEEERHAHLVVESSLVRVGEQRGELVGVDAERRERHAFRTILCGKGWVDR
jgi:hypothetical protein